MDAVEPTGLLGSKTCLARRLDNESFISRHAADAHG